jgi:hypothetical protein
MYPSARFTVFCQLSCSGFHPCSPPGSYTLLRYIHRVLSSSLYSGEVFRMFYAHVTLFCYSCSCGLCVPCGSRCGCSGPSWVCFCWWSGSVYISFLSVGLMSHGFVAVIVVYFIDLFTISFALAIVLATALASMFYSVSFSSVSISSMPCAP